MQNPPRRTPVKFSLILRSHLDNPIVSRVARAPTTNHVETAASAVPPKRSEAERPQPQIPVIPTRRASAKEESAGQPHPRKHLPPLHPAPYNDHRMRNSRIAELLEPFMDSANNERLRAEDLQRISTYIDILQRWNARINLTAIRDEEEIVTRHFGESFFAARHLVPTRVATGASPVPPGRSPAASGIELRDQRRHLRAAESESGRAALQGRVLRREEQGASAPAVTNDQRPRANGAARVADVGSGAGFPGIPIKLWAPEIALTLIESNHKKATFLKEVTRFLILTDVNIQTARAESLPGSSFDVVTLRAVELFESILPVAARLVAPGGRLALLIGQTQLPQAQSVLPALDWSDPIPVPKSQSRVLGIACKTMGARKTS